jgi:hypothetical protein
MARLLADRHQTAEWQPSRDCFPGQIRMSKIISCSQRSKWNHSLPWVGVQDIFLQPMVGPWLASM